MVMKIYRFSLETGVFQGEDFADEAPLNRGEYIIPDDATTIPPPSLKRGEVPFFNPREQQWEVRFFPVSKRKISPADDNISSEENQ